MGAVTEAINGTLKAIAASLLMEQVLVPRFNFTPKATTVTEQDGFNYGEGGYKPDRCNVGFNEESGHYHVEIKGLVEPKSQEAERICQEDINEVITAFVQDKPVIKRGLFDKEMLPEENTLLRMGKIIKDKYSELEEHDVEAVRQRAVAALNLTQQAKTEIFGGDRDDWELKANTALIDGVRKFVSVRDLDIDLIDSINPFGQAYSILSVSMDQKRLRQVESVISAKRNPITPEDAIVWAKRASKFKKDIGRSPSVTATDPYEKLMAVGATAFMRFRKEGRYE